MLGYAFKRFLGAVPTLFLIVTMAFFMMRAAPGGPFNSARKLPPEIERNIKAAYNLDKPLMVQYGIYLERLAQGDLGPSYKNKDFTVAQLIGIGLPVSVKLGLWAMALAISLGVSLGVWAALRQNRWQDYSVMTLAMFGITIPTFVTAPILTLIFGIYGVSLFGFDLTLPVGGWNGGAWRNMILPVTVLALPQIAIIARLTRGSMIEVLHSNYIRTARAKGLSAHAVVVRHALRAALLPLVSYLGPAVAGILTGSLIVEEIFGVPGIGRYFIQAALNRDYTLVMGVVICYAALIIALNFLADILYGLLDPRVSRMIAIGAPAGRKAETLERAFVGRSLWADARRRLLRNRAAVAGMAVLAIIALMALLAPLLSHYSYEAIDYSIVSCAPDWWPIEATCRAGGTHWFGTDAVGRDLFVRVLYGARVSLTVGFVATLVSLVIGVVYGATAGYLGGRVDAVMMRAVDILYSLPFIFFVIILMVMFDRNFFLLFVAIGAVVWLTMARIVRGQTLSAKHKEYIEAARAAGVSSFGIITRHIIPNVAGPVVVYVTLTVPDVILTESFLSFLGLGIQEPLTSWGVLISDGANTMESAPWMLIFPALLMGVTLFCFNFIGDGLRDALDPKDY